MPLLFRTHFKLAKSSIKENYTRSLLTCLGIAVGVAAIILILSLMGSINNLVKQEVAEIGADLIVVRPTPDKDSVTNAIEELTNSNSFGQSNLNLTDVETIRDVENVTAVAPIATSTNTVASYKNTLPSVRILGTTPDFIEIEPLAIRFGSFLNDKNKQNGVVLGHTLSLTLFNTMNSTVGDTITIMGEKFIVVGVLNELDKSVNFDNVDLDNALIMDIETMNEVIGPSQIQQINIKAATTDALESTSTQIDTNLKDNKAGDQNFTVSYGDEITHPADSFFSIISGILTLVAAISLIVGGIGIMNIMLVSVAERTHEIGIRKAVGASTRNILMQFLFEALILSFSGGVIGLLLGYFIALMLSTVTPFQPYLSWEILVLTLLLTIIVGIVFGIYPALKAATKDPIESLKHYR